jgi:hypothetical protein
MNNYETSKAWLDAGAAEVGAAHQKTPPTIGRRRPSFRRF